MPRGALPRGKSGNPPGKPKGVRNRSTLAAEALPAGEAAAFTRKAVELARKGDPTALKLCLDRIEPRRRERAEFVRRSAFKPPPRSDPAATPRRPRGDYVGRSTLSGQIGPQLPYALKSQQ